MSQLTDAPRIPVERSGRLIPQASAATAFASIAIVCWLAAALIGTFVVTGTGALASSDYRIGGWFDGLGIDNPWMVNLALVWHWAGGPIGTFLLAVISTVVLLVIGRRGWALYVVACGVGGLVIAELIKRTVERPRPNWPDAVIVESGGSFPSGHSMAGVYVWSVVGIVVMYLMRRPAGTVIGWCIIAFGLLMAPSRLIIGVHWPSDVVGGWLLALGWVLIVTACAVVIVARRTLTSPPTPTETEPAASA